MRNSLIRECLRIAKEKNEKHQENFRHFSFITTGSKIIEHAVNRTGPPLVQRGFAVYGKLHSETEAYRRASGLLGNDEAFECINVRLNRQNELRLSAPCPCCTAFLRTAGCTAVWFSTNNEFARIKL